MKKNANLLTKINEKNSYENNKEKLIKKPQSILFSDCEKCWQTTKKQDEIVDKKHLNLEDSKNNQLLKRVLFWRKEKDFKNNQKITKNENKANEKRGEKSMGRVESKKERTKNKK